MSASTARRCVCPGTYDPITNGHVDVIGRASEMFDEVIVAVVNQSVRKSKGIFGIEERLAPALTEAIEGLMAPGGSVVSESDRRAPLPLDLPLTDERRYGDTLIRIHQS